MGGGWRAMFGGRGRPVGRRGSALLVNTTALSYHLGCYGTSMMLEHGLIEAGYSVTSFPVETTHTALVYPEVEAPYDGDAYAAALKLANPHLHQALRTCDLLVVNGEGTLHGSHAGPRGLLGLMRFAKIGLAKPVLLLNHSCFPGGRGSADPATELFYRSCLGSLDAIVAREPWSTENYRQLGIAATQGFDCLPLYASRFLRAGAPRRSERLVVGTVSNWNEAAAQALGEILREVARQLGAAVEIVFLGGGGKKPPEEDAMHVEAIRSAFPGLYVLDPATLQDWMDAIASAQLLVTGRFHHVVASATVGTETLFFPGNTAKTDALSDWLAFGGRMTLDEPDLAARIVAAFRARQQPRPQMRRLADLASRNIAAIEAVARST